MTVRINAAQHLGKPTLRCGRCNRSAKHVTGEPRCTGGRKFRRGLCDDCLFEQHRKADPHCTCNDCIAFHSKESN